MSNFIRVTAQHVRHVSGFEVYSVDRFHIGFRDATGKYEIGREIGWDPIKMKGHEYLYINNITSANSDSVGLSDEAKMNMVEKVIEGIKFMDDFDVEVVSDV